MKRLLYKYTDAKRNLLKYFGCNDDYHITLCTDHQWYVMHDEGVSILFYGKDGRSGTSAVVVRKDGKPLIYTKNDLTMIIAIDCIKIAFVMKNVYHVDV